MTFARGKPKGKLKKLGDGARHRHDDHFQPDDEIFGGKLQLRRRADRASGSRPRATCTAASRSCSRRDEVAGGRRTTFVHPQGIAEFLPKLVAERGKTPVPPSGARVLHGEARRGRAARHRARAAVDRGDRRAHPVVRQRHPDARRRHARAGLRAAIVKAVRNYIATHKLEPEGRDAHGRGHPRGRRRRALDRTSTSRSSRARPRTGSTTPRSRAQVEAIVRPGARELAQREPELGPRRSSRA